MTKEELVQVIYSTMPYPSQIRDLDFTTEDNAVRFSWRCDRFRVVILNTTISVEQVEGNVLVGSNITIILNELLNQNCPT